MTDSPTEALSSPTQPSPGDILLVDDNLDNLRMLSALLRERGYAARSVTTGSAALMGATAQPPDLILLDVNMPGMSGYEVCRQLKAREATQAIPVIFLSALNEVFNKVEAFAVGGVDYITKPFQIEEVFARIETQLALQRLQTQLRQQNQRLQEAEAELSRALTQERALNEKIAEMSSLEERNRIARDIHDSLGHALVALNIQLEAALTLWHSQPDQAHNALKEAKQLGSQALQSVRTSVTEIRADNLQGELLEQAIRGLVQEFQQATKVSPEVHLDLSLPFPNAVNMVVYRIVQEGLTNICKHAKATAVRVAIQTAPDHLKVNLTDDGQGFCAHHDPSGYGLLGMRERVTALGGTFNIESNPGQGCQLVALFPRITT
jgi:two-component system sensor histidine kinase/response regulator